MSSNNLCFDTNVIISYLFFIEPNHDIVQKFINQSSDNFFYSKTILVECDKIITTKISFIKNLLGKLIIYLDDYHNTLFNENKLITNFLKLDYEYFYKDNKVNNTEIENIIYDILIIIDCENIEGFYLQKKLIKLNLSLNNHITLIKQSLFNNFTLIDKHLKNYDEIKNILLDVGSHYEDNEIILDLYEYYLNNNIEFIYITFDKKLFVSLQKCNFKFIKKIWDLDKIKNFI